MNDDQLIALMAAVLFAHPQWDCYDKAVTDARGLRSESLRQLQKEQRDRHRPTQAVA